MFHRIATCFTTWLVLGCLLSGCGSPLEPSERTPSRPRTATKPRPTRQTAARPSRMRSGQAPEVEPLQDDPALEPRAMAAPAADEPAGSHAGETSPQERRSLADLLDQPVDSAPRWIAHLPRLRVDDARAAAAGIRKLAGKRLTLYTDMPPAEEIARLPKVFDLAFPQWCSYFHIDAAAHSDWRMTGFLMRDKARFQRAGLLPADLPPFRHGFARNYVLWLYDQPSDYYRRHLLLHEGTHGLMNTILGGCGPPWYMEGMAELLATHRLSDGRLTLNQIPAGREDVPYWGRIKIIKDAIAQRRPMRLKGVIDYPIQAHLATEPYAWCWAAAALLDGHPRYSQRFRRLYKYVLEPDFNERFYRLIGDDWGELCEEWQLLVNGLEYGHDIARTAIDFTPGRPLPPEGASARVAADRGWQNSGLRLDAGVSYSLQASGRYQVADQPKVWWCEPGGVSIRYYRGRPLGILLAAVRTDRPKTGSSGLLRPTPVGLAATLTPGESGTLYLKINDSPAELHDNAGELKVEIRRE